MDPVKMDVENNFSDIDGEREKWANCWKHMYMKNGDIYLYTSDRNMN